MTEAILSPPRRTRFIAAVTSAMALARKAGIVEVPVLEKEALLERAAAYTGLDDFGDPWFE